MVRFHHTMDTHTVGVLGVAVEGKLMGYLVGRRERDKRGGGGRKRGERDLHSN